MPIPEPSAKKTPKQTSHPTRTRILEAAERIISQEGYAGATTRAIAAEAGVNEVTLFRHFGSKRNLLAELVDQYSALPQLAGTLENQFTGDLRQDLELLGSMFLSVIRARRQALRLMLCEAERIPEVRQIMASLPRQMRRTLAGYLERQMQAGVMRHQHAEAAAQAFLGMFFAYNLVSDILGEDIQPVLTQEQVVASFVDLFIRGASPVSS